MVIPQVEEIKVNRLFFASSGLGTRWAFDLAVRAAAFWKANFTKRTAGYTLMGAANGPKQTKAREIFLSGKPINCIDTQELVRKLPKRFASAPMNIGAGPFALFCPKGRIVKLRVVLKCLAVTPESAKPVIAAVNLTAEAKQEVADVGGSTITLDNFHWTEKSAKSIGVPIGSRLKNSISRKP